MYLPPETYLGTFNRYWDNHFRPDLERVLAARPPKGGHGPGFFVQPWRIANDNPVVRVWSDRHREYFAVSLYLTLRLDRFVAGRHPNHHRRFDREFQAPTLLGDCPGGCRLHLPPEDALFCLGTGRTRWQDRVPVIPDPELLPQVEGIVRRIVALLLPDQSADHFWGDFARGWQPAIVLAAVVNAGNLTARTRRN